MKSILTHTLGMGVAGLLLTMGLAGQATAATMAVDDFTTITNGVFFDIGQTSNTGQTFGGVTITGNPPNTGIIFSGAGGTPTPADPGDNTGWLTSSSVILSFDIPVAAFGVSFNMRSFFTPTTLEAFSGLNGTGTSLGVVSPIIPIGSDIIDFVGLWSDALDIQSVVLSSVQGTMQADGYGLSLTPFESQQPIPEPSTMLLLGSGLVGLIGYRWKKAHA